MSTTAPSDRKHFGPFSFIFIKTYLLVLIPLILLPIIFLDSTREKELKCLYVLLIMATFWILQVLPLVVTSFIPVIIFPLMNILTTKEVSSEYLTSTNFLFLSGLIFAIAVEDCGLDNRIAILFIDTIGSGTKTLLTGIMFVTALLSMLVSNTATTAMMIPVLNGILSGLEGNKNKKFSNFKNGLLLAIAYSANIGGTGFLTGSPPNLVAPEILERRFGPAADINFLKWALFAMPIMLSNLVLSGIWIYIFFGFSSFQGEKDHSEGELENGRVVQCQSNSEVIREALRKKKKDLGPITMREILIATIFGITLLLWFFKTPRIFEGWSSLFPNASISAATPAFFMIMFLFIFPRELSFWPFQSKDESPKNSESLLTWTTIEKKLPWGIMFLLGGGYALAKGTRESGLSQWMVDSLKIYLSPLNKWVINLIFCITTTFATEVISNTAAANIIIPILINVAISVCESPVYFAISATISSSYAFMVPVATAPNALVFEASTLSQWTMIKAGFVMNIVCITTTAVAINFYANYIFAIDPIPQWLVNFFQESNQTNCLPPYANASFSI